MQSINQAQRKGAEVDTSKKCMYENLASQLVIEMTLQSLPLRTSSDRLLKTRPNWTEKLKNYIVCLLDYCVANPKTTSTYNDDFTLDLHVNYCR